MTGTVFATDDLTASDIARLQPPNNVCICSQEETNLFEQQHNNLRCSWLRRLSPAEAQSQAQQLTEDVYSSYNKLRQILLSRETILRAR